MSTTTNNELEQLKQLINSRFDKVDNRLGKVEERMKGKISGMESSVQKIPDLAAKMGELKNWK